MKHKVRWWNTVPLIQHRTVIALILFALFPSMLTTVYTHENEILIPHQEVEHWAKKIGNHIFHLSNTFARYNGIVQQFKNNDAKLLENDGFTLVKEMAEDVTNMMKFKVEAVKRIMNVAEEASLDKDYKPTDEVDYYNAKRLNDKQDGKLKEGFRDLNLLSNTHFGGIAVNENVSSVHVPTNVYDKADDVINAIRWSGRLDRTFKSNYELDPTLSWQYFGSSAGFLRQYPAAKWEMDKVDPDLYDARLRSWYIQAANSPKDMVILLDVSGSMTGLRREIAKHVVLNILETLNENDFVNVFNFSEETVPLVPCFNNTLVQANLENIGEFKKALTKGETKDIANFTQALTTGFSLLQQNLGKQYNKTGQGSQCNQAIMLVTDGAPYFFRDVFSKFNWPHLQVRMFTYLIGRDEAMVRHLKWMACSNKGFFAHVTTLAEVREQVLKYIPVMARPMVMYQSNHPHIWTGVYADIADPKQTEWFWELRERMRQKERTGHYKELKQLAENKNPDDPRLNDPNQVEKFLKYGEFDLSERDIARKLAEDKKRNGYYMGKRDLSSFMESNKTKSKRMKRDVCYMIPKRIHDYDLWMWYQRLLREKAKVDQINEAIRMGREDSPGLKHGYRLMTSVSVPVFDRKKTSNITERVLVNESIWIIRKREVRTANLLGVAGTDVPIREIEKLVPPYKLGVNGYSFMVNRNGYILYHPDLRPVFQNILKPNYNSVDFAEVELVDQEGGPRANDSDLLELTMWRDYNNKLRRDLIEQRPTESVMDVKIHMDQMKRVITRRQRYHTQKVDGTPFSLGIAMPEGYGKYKVSGQIELSRAMHDLRRNIAVGHFSSGNWSLHPEWVYCEYKYDQNREDLTPEELMLDFLSRAQQPAWKWRSTRTRPPPEPTMNQAQFNNWKTAAVEEEKKYTNYYCDKDLVQSLVFDARATNVYDSQQNMDDLSDNRGHNFGITTSFVATRSGLTRWLDLTKTGEDAQSYSDEPHFMKLHNKAIDEVWYKRAVDYYDEDPQAYVYSVPFDAATRPPGEVLVTATRAIFIEENDFRKAPAAVVGVTIKHNKFVDYFKNETYKLKNGCPSYPTTDSSCRDAKTCESTSLDCYLLDDNGFIIASEKDEDTGKFFGTLEGTIMESLVQSEVYKRIKIFDYQAVCLDSELESSPANILATPLQMLRWSANWLMGNIFWLMVKTHLYTLWDPNEAWAFTHTEQESQYPNINEPPQEMNESPESMYDEHGVHLGDTFPTEETQGPVPDDGAFPKIELAYINKTRPRPCDKEVHLYKLQNHKLMTDGAYKPVKGKLSNCHTNGCGRPFSVQKVISTNLILVAVNNLCPCESRKVDIEPIEIDYNETMHCSRLLLSHFRKRPGQCFNYHPDEQEIKLCGGAGALSVPVFTMFSLVVLTHVFVTFRLQS